MAASSSAAGAVATGGVVKAADLLPSAFGSAARIDSSGKADDLAYDLGSLTAVDTHQVDFAKLHKKKEAYLHKLATTNAQLLMARIFSLDTETTDQGPVVKLPLPSKELPREKPVPQPKAPTRWDEYAAEKGLQKRKKSRKVWDDDRGDWKTRFGYQEGKDDLSDWAVPVKKGADRFVDPWEEAKVAKKKRVLNNKLNQIANIERANHGKTGRRLGVVVPAGIPAQLTMGEGSVGGLTGQGKRSKGKARGESLATKKARMAAVQLSTASLGKFDRKVSGEGARPSYSAKSRKGRMSVTATDKEAARNRRTLKQVLGSSMGEGLGTGVGGDVSFVTKPKKARDGIIVAARAGGKKRRRG